MSIRDTIIPSLGLHAGLSGLAYAASRVANRAEGKDYLWPAGLVLNAWYHSVLRHTLRGVPLTAALRELHPTQRLVLGGVTLWGGRLFYRIVKRSVQRGHDDPRYAGIKTPGAWTLALGTKFLPEALVQTLIALSWSLPFNGVTSPLSAPREYAGLLHALAVGLFAVGLGMETLADWQLETHKDGGELFRGGVWSIVRHPNYLGDALVHFSIPLLLYSDGQFYPLTLLGPAINYLFLRYIGGDKENESSQESRYAQSNKAKYAQLKAWQRESNAFWPRVGDVVGNPWAAGLVGFGVAVAAVERFVRRV